MMRRARYLGLLPLLAAFALVVPACGGGGGGDGEGVSTTLDEYSITLDPTSASAGSVTFNIQNGGDKVHEFVVFKTDLAEDALPVVGDEVDEASLDLIDEQEDIAPGSSTDLTVDLEAGNYVVICNLTAHYSKGMHASFTVS